MIKRAFGEWEEQELIMLSLPHENSDWNEYLDEILLSYENFVKAIIPYQKVLLIAPNSNIFEKIFSKFDNVYFMQIPTNDTWIRDYGAIDVMNGDKIISYDFKFNAWGNKFNASLDNNVNKILFENYFKTELKEINLILEGGSIDFNGNGVMLTTKECLLNHNRNSSMNKDELDIELKNLFGLKQIIWLENGFIDGDDTDSHVDTLARFIDEDTIAYSISENPNDKEYMALLDMQKELRKTEFTLIPLPLPQVKFYNGKKLGATYANFVFINEALIVPTYNDKNDKIVINRLKKALPGRKIVGVDATVFIRQNGSLHCSTQNRFIGKR
ncbi:agmatine deiminase family protein [Campylobacter sputorum]|uniref:agmatine deiminase family protein n=1 Tax=Campylobacter sputorum TaxID=206 RepID=UPI00053BDE55|nr:agmatine deiminase family protein [Campylobacter sputorum]